MKWFVRQSKRKKVLVVALILAVVSCISFSISVFAESSGEGENTGKKASTETEGQEPRGEEGDPSLNHRLADNEQQRQQRGEPIFTDAFGKPSEHTPPPFLICVQNYAIAQKTL